jgi:hypothetical protein
VVTDQYGRAGVPPGGYMITECKYSINQPWHKRACKILSEHAVANKFTLITQGRDLLIWDLDDTMGIVMWNQRPKSAEFLEYVSKNFQIIDIQKKTPQYITKALDQAELYRPWLPENISWFLPTVCLGQKNAKRRIMVCRNKSYEEQGNV